MTLKVCSHPDCPAIQAEAKCAEHRRQHERERGTRQQRGYGADHEAHRAKWAPLVATGNVKCWRCGEYIAAGEPWDDGHDDADRSRYRGPEHPGCNRATASRISPRA